jgi:hypothetical protein
VAVASASRRLQAMEGAPHTSTQDGDTDFEGATYSMLGDGAATFFWTDNWLPDGRICDIAPILFAAVPRRGLR